MHKCHNCRFTPCTVAQGVNCCLECEFHCGSMCELARQILLKERENKMKVGAKKETGKNIITVTRAHQFEDGGIAFDMIINGVTIYNNKLVEGEKGTFVSFPSRKGKDGKYYSYVFIKLSADEVAGIVAQIEKL